MARQVTAKRSPGAHIVFLVIAATYVGPWSDCSKAQSTSQAASPTVMQTGLDGARMNMLIRTTLIALSQANQTGNYSVLRDLGSPEFQLQNTAARLTEAFSELRRRRLDFSPILFFDPKLVREPSFDEAGRLRLTGFIDTRPEQVTFDMMFANAAGEWRLFGLAVEMRPNATGSVPQPEKPAPMAAAKVSRSPQKAAPAIRKSSGWAPVNTQSAQGQK